MTRADLAERVHAEIGLSRADSAALVEQVLEEMCEAVRDGRIRPGQLLLLEAMGGGFTWGAAAVRY